MRILIAEDEADLNHIIAKRLRLEGHSTDSCFDGEEALDFLRCADYDALILDVMMPKVDGFELIRRLREQGCATPVLFLTARDAVSDRVKGLDLGASDYLVKPFAFDELLARLRAITRKSGGHLSNLHKIADLELDTAARSACRGGRPIALSAKEYALLEYLVLEQNTVLSREKIENRIWNYEYEGGTNVVDVYIRYLRKKIDEGFEPKLIHTVRGAGYVLRVQP